MAEQYTEAAALSLLNPSKKQKQLKEGVEKENDDEEEKKKFIYFQQFENYRSFFL